MIYRCDEPMKHKKESAMAKAQDARQWKCKGNCSRCVCGLKKNPDGTWEHINMTSKLLEEKY